MEAFCEQEDRKEMKKTKQSNLEMEDDINYFEDLGEDSVSIKVNYLFLKRLFTKRDSDSE